MSLTVKVISSRFICKVSTVESIQISKLSGRGKPFFFQIYSHHMHSVNVTNHTLLYIYVYSDVIIKLIISDIQHIIF